MSLPSDSGSEHRFAPSEVVDFWLPSSLTTRMSVVARHIKLAPLVFLRKAVELHENHRSSDPVYKPDYPDQSVLQTAFNILQRSELLKQLQEAELDGYLQQLDQASLARMSDQDPRDREFTVAPVRVSSDIAVYIDSCVSPEASPGYYLSAQALGIAATLDLVWLYSVAESMNGSTAA